MSVVVTNKNGKMLILLNPNEKATKFAREMKTGLKFAILKVENKKMSLRYDLRNSYHHQKVKCCA